uniref:Uncharacterized protein isoform X1 n=1 Tax=Pogona vitticeps TaxID=103695 RepID=A0ABM5GL38_9SAUR
MAHRRLAEALRLSRHPAAGRPRQPLERRRPSAELEPLPAPVPVPVPVRGRRRRRTLSAPRRARLSHDASGIFSLAFAAGGGCVAAGFGNGAVQVRRGRDGRTGTGWPAGRRATPILPGAPREARPSPSGPSGLSFQLADAATGAPGASLLPRSRARQAATALAFHRAQPGLLLAAGADGTLTVYDLLAHRPASSWTEEENEIHALDFCRDGSAFATAGKDRHVRLYDSHTTQLFQVFEPPDFMAGDEFGPLSGHSRRIFALRFHPTELHLFLTGGWDNSVKVWDKRVPKGARSAISGPHICGPGIDVKGDLVLTGSWVPRNALQLWDLRTSRLCQNLPFPGSSAQGEFLYSARFCAEDMVLAGGSGSCGATVIHMDTSQVDWPIALIAFLTHQERLVLPHLPPPSVVYFCCFIGCLGFSPAHDSFKSKSLAWGPAEQMLPITLELCNKCSFTWRDCCPDP